MIEFLIISGADPNTQNSNGDTPLYMIIESRDLPFEGEFISLDPLLARSETLRALLLRSADAGIRNF